MRTVILVSYMYIYPGSDPTGARSYLCPFGAHFNFLMHAVCFIFVFITHIRKNPKVYRAFSRIYGTHRDPFQNFIVKQAFLTIFLAFRRHSKFEIAPLRLQRRQGLEHHGALSARVCKNTYFSVFLQVLRI